MPPEVRGETRRGARPPPFPARSERSAKKKAADALVVKPSDEIFLPPDRLFEALDAVSHPTR